ncbi:hypothetical protein A2803_03745 [Candidatus Woesebacteria bacterium RIFCSPHIGHO2_01_FULL_44_21]|uniref:AB hydrolase-1 domain-containing protein n=1 Tax=Candidatus Woesebacteria bacterium RIFCSPHIGHO2_01_FULL_44_21 TaxID=1802503 RepID=A0A1F7YWI3_9BACT|nr:MAG: hypothetical protein A2803_03745 [Candidatus Woesebacteria bacterium RIFCSPHIGHO2_01_FULL_44_21]
MKMHLETFFLGKGEPLLFLGGASSPFGYYEKFVNLLSKHYKVYFFNYPGLGKSEKPKSHSLEVYLKAVDQVVKENNLKNYYLAGASFGGFLALEYAFVYPGNIKALILFSPLTRLFSKIKISNVIRIALTQLQKWQAECPPMTQNVFTYKHFFGAVGKYRHSEFVIKLEVNPKHIAKNIPILVVLGDKDKLIDSSYSKQVFEKHKNAKIIIIKGGSHDAFATIGGRIIKIINDFSKGI